MVRVFEPQDSLGLGLLAQRLREQLQELPHTNVPLPRFAQFWPGPIWVKLYLDCSPTAAELLGVSKLQVLRGPHLIDGF